MRPDLLRMKEVALIYLDRSGGLQKFMDACKVYNDSKQSYAIFRFLILVNPSDITELDATLGNYILHEPVKAIQIFQSVCFTTVKTLSLIQQLQTEAQMSIVLKLTHLPSLPSYVLSLSKLPFDYTSQRFYMTEGIVVAMSTVTKYTQGARFVCFDEKCPFSEGFQYIRVHTPGATESATVRNDFVCTLCTSPLREDMKYRVLGDKQIIEMIDTKAISAFQGFSSCKTPFRIQSFTVFLRDELSNKMKIGNRYKVIGIPVCIPSCSQITLCLEANSVHLSNLTGPSCISGNFKYLLSLTSSSCWRFTALLANCFASQILPPGIYNTLKLAILLSLVQTSDRDNTTADYLDLLIMTNESLTLERVMNYSISLVTRGIRHIQSDVFPTVSKDKHGTGTASIQANSALLAKGGICFIGELPSYKKDKLEQLQSVLEGRTTTIFISGKKYGEDTDQQVILPIQTSFWSFIDVDFSSSKKHVQRDNTLTGQMDLSFISANLIDAFGLLIHCSESPFSNSVLPVVNHILKKAINPKEAVYTVSQQFRTQDYKKFLAFSKNLHVELCSEAERLIHGYYLASRRVRTHPVNGSSLSGTALKILISLSKAHAKLSLRTKVVEEDVLIAVLLFESSLTLKHGASVFCVAPNAVFPFELNSENSLDQRDIYLLQCHKQLKQFIATYGPATHVLSNEV
ncbi:minichromosome maintenance domain-containing protein 2 [Rhineura floridana]|uniref:minichromosome maintenance domain-containing protein 2 n=1 Tax=Rhineura floridana TaxID=261503 RepID=UPI002AC84BE5|nr:minichromosome maintenance domain-containing protein 2 [Rhineura floridana]